MPSYSAKRKTTYRRRPYYKRKPMNPYTVAKIAKRVVNSQKPFREARFNLWHPLDTSVLANSFGIDHLTDIQIGNEVDNRTGKSIFLKGIKFNVSLTNNSLGKPRVVRCLVVHTRNKDGDLLDTSTWTDLYTSNTFGDRPADAKSGDIVFPINRDILDVYYDRLVTLSTETSFRGCAQFSKYLKINRKVTYDDSGSPGIGPQLTSGRFYVIFHVCEPDDTLDASVVRITGLARVFFTDA